MKKVAFALLIASIFLSLNARELTPEEALSRATAGSTMMKAPRDIIKSQPKLIYSVKSGLADREAAAYLFTNTNGGKGYMLVSADDRLTPLLGYSTDATITDTSEMPENMKWWLSELAREADYAIENGITPGSAYLNLGPSVEPLLTSKWGQDNPYNLYTPVIDGGHAPTGCVATALAQIMHYHKWPEQPVGCHSYTDNGNTYSIDYSTVRFDWNKMSDTYDSESTDESKDAVATLMKAVGYGVDMQYGLWESGAFGSSAETAMTSFFGYNKNCRLMSRGASNQWAEAIYHNLSNGMPVYYLGEERIGPFQGGHAFVCDGYDGEAYFHFNWGWDGNSDGYFLLSKLNAGTNSEDFIPGYNFNQFILINLFPDNGNLYNEYIGLTCNYSYYPQENQIIISVDCPIELGAVEIAFGYSEKYSDDIQYEPLGNVQLGSSWQSIDIPAEFPDKLDREKSYHLNLYWRKEGIQDQSNWTLAWASCYELFFNGEIWNTRNHDHSGMEISELHANYGTPYCDTLISGIPNYFTFKVKNSNDENLFSTLNFTLRHDSGSISPKNMYITLPPGAEQECTIFINEDLKKGSGYFYIVGERNDFEIKELSDYNTLSHNSVIYMVCGNNEVSLMGLDSTTPFDGHLYIPDNFQKDGIEYNVTEPNQDLLGFIVSTNKVTELTIGYPLTVIKDLVFCGCTELKSVKLPTELKHIGKYAFEWCTGLQNITFENSLLSIGDYAFLCSALSGDLVFPDALTSIGHQAFDGCKNIESIKFGNSLESIGNSAFGACDHIESLSFGNSLLSIGDYAFSECSALSGDLVFPDALTSIGHLAFYGCKNIESIKFGNSLESIGNSAFEVCYHIGSIKFGNSLESIGNQAFLGCSSLSGDLVFPDALTSIGSYAFYGCKNIESIKFGNSLESIGDNAFYGCSALSGDLFFPDALTSIGSYAFGSCKNIESIKFENSLESIGDCAFIACDHIESLSFGKSLLSIGNGTFSGCSALSGDLVFPDALTSIGNGAFYGCKNIGSIKFGNSLESIGNSAFEVCYHIESIKFGNSLESIGNQAFLGCSSLSGDLVFPDALTSIGSYAFGCCNYIKCLSIPRSLTFIGEGAFSDCRNLKEIHISDIESWCNIDFEDPWANPCSYFGETWNGSSVIRGTFIFENEPLIDIVIPNSITFIKNYAFFNNATLKSIEIPETVNLIGVGSFYSCNNLESIIVRSSTPPTVLSEEMYDTFDQVKANLYVPDDAIDAYKQHPVWKRFLNRTYGTSSIDEVEIGESDYDAEGRWKPCEVYNFQGQRILHNASAEDVDALPSGLYIIRGRKLRKT